MKITLVRNATLVIDYAGHRMLVDPALDPVGARPPIPNTANERRNPLVPVPETTWPLIDSAETVILTHLHKDHVDDTGADRLPKAHPVYALPGQVETVAALGFTDVRPIASIFTIGDITVHRTEGRHGTGAIGDAMAPVCGFVLEHPDEPTLYIAGDTIWCDHVEAAIDHYAPNVIVVNAGGARFNEGGPIVMTIADVLTTAQHAPDAEIVTVHLEAINHCLDTRADLSAAARRHRVTVPDDGQTLVFAP